MGIVIYQGTAVVFPAILGDEEISGGSVCRVSKGGIG